jgi:hypothetical protein
VLKVVRTAQNNPAVFDGAGDGGRNATNASTPVAGAAGVLPSRRPLPTEFLVSESLVSTVVINVHSLAFMFATGT